MLLKREVRKYIEAELRDYHQTIKDLTEAREQLILDSQFIESLGRRSTRVSKPTETKTIRLLTNKRIKRMEQTIRAIEKVIESLPAEKYRLVELRYWQRRRALTDEGIAMEIKCDKRTLYRWVEGILLAIAIELGEAN